jgi:cytochrome c
MEEISQPPEGHAALPEPVQTFSVRKAVGLIARADAGEGAALFKRCAVCHTAAKDAPHSVGPNLWGIVGMPRAFQSGYVYSAALANDRGLWRDEDLAAYLNNPRAFAPGTTMAFAGLSKESDVAAVIAYLRTLSDRPEPLP